MAQWTLHHYFFIVCCPASQWTLTVVCLNFGLRNFASILNSIFPVLKHLTSSALIQPSQNWQFSGQMLLHSAYANPIASKPQLLLLVCCWSVGNMTTNWSSFGLNIHRPVQYCCPTLLRGCHKCKPHYFQQRGCLLSPSGFPLCVKFEQIAWLEYPQSLLFLKHYIKQYL